MANAFSLGGSQNAEYDVAIIGGGPAGATAAMYAARADLKTIVLDKSAAAGALAITSKIANYPGVEEVLTGTELLRRMRAQAESFGAEFVTSQVMTVDLESTPKMLNTSTGFYQAKAVIVASGRMGRKNKVPGEEEFLGRGVSYCATCDAAFFRDKVVAVVGSSEHAVEEALFTTQFARQVTLLAPGDKLTAHQELVSGLSTHPKLTVEYKRPLRGIEGNGTVTGVRVGGKGGETTLPADGVFIFLPGNQPILDFAEGVLKLTPSGCVDVGSDRATNIPGVYAIGDLLCSYVQQAVVAAADGAIAAMAAEAYVRGRSKAKSDWG